MKIWILRLHFFEDDYELTITRVFPWDVEVQAVLACTYLEWKGEKITIYIDSQPLQHPTN